MSTIEEPTKVGAVVRAWHTVNAEWRYFMRGGGSDRPWRGQRLHLSWDEITSMNRLSDFTVTYPGEDTPPPPVKEPTGTGGCDCDALKSSLDAKHYFEANEALVRELAERKAEVARLAVERDAANAEARRYLDAIAAAGLEATPVHVPDGTSPTFRLFDENDGTTVPELRAEVAQWRRAHATALEHVRRLRAEVRRLESLLDAERDATVGNGAERERARVVEYLRGVVTWNEDLRFFANAAISDIESGRHREGAA